MENKQVSWEDAETPRSIRPEGKRNKMASIDIDLVLL